MTTDVFNFGDHDPDAGETPKIQWRPTSKLLLVDAYDPEDFLEALFNPEALELGDQAEIGVLNPVGSSHPVLQYAYTMGVSFSITLVFTHMAMRVLRGTTGEFSIHAPADWLTSFTYPRAPGVAPPPLILSWPRTMSMLVAVRQVSVAFERWFGNGEPRAIGVKASFSELRRADKRTGDQRSSGWRNLEYGISMGGAQTDFVLGAPPSRIRMSR